MDPSHRPNAAPARGPRRRAWSVLAPLAVATAVGTLLVVSAGEALRPARAVTVAPVVPARFEPGLAAQDDDPTVDAPVGVTVQAPGWLEADPFITACSALADGVVREVLVLEGDPVQQGELVARLVDDDARLSLGLAVADVRSAEATVALAEADVAAARTDWEQPVERERAVGTSRAALDEARAERVQLDALIDRDRAVLVGLVEEYDRAAELLETGAINDLELILLRARVDTQRAALAATESRRTILDAKVDRLAAEARAAERAATLRVEERRALATAEAELLRQRAALEHAEVRRAEAALRLERMEIRSPITGFVQRRLKTPGSKVMLGMDDPHSAHVLHVYDPARIQVRVDVPLADASHVSVGQRCEVVVEVLPDTTFAGEVTRITHEADLQKNTLQVKVRVIDPSPFLRPEMLTRVRFLPIGSTSRGNARGGDRTRTEDATRRVLVHPDSIVGNGADAHVLAVRERRGRLGTVVRVPIAFAPATAAASADGGTTIATDWLDVQASLQPGDLLVIADEDARAGDLVRVREDLAPGNGGVS